MRSGGSLGGRVTVATLNVRNTADGWRRRRRLLVEQLQALGPDLIGLQELRTVPDQAAWIRRQATPPGAPGPPYRVHRAAKTGLWGLWEGIGTLSRLPVVDAAVLDLGAQHRVAQRLTVQLPGGGPLELYNTHLATGDDRERAGQVSRLLDWMAASLGVPQVLVGDFNASRATGSMAIVYRRLRSAHATIHGREPGRTVPTPLRPGPVAGGGVVMDYVFVNELLDVHDAKVVFDIADPGDARLLPSDHYGVLATLAVRASGEARQ